VQPGAQSPASPPATIFPTLFVMQKLHEQLEANRHFEGLYPDDLRTATLGEIAKLQQYQQRLSGIPDQTRTMVDTLLTQVFAPMIR
jgi:hypothetical protein